MKRTWFYVFFMVLLTLSGVESALAAVGSGMGGTAGVEYQSRVVAELEFRHLSWESIIKQKRKLSYSTANYY